MRFHGGSSIFPLICQADGINKKEDVGGGAGLIAGTPPFRDASGSTFIHSFIHPGCFSFIFFLPLHNGRQHRRHLVLDSGQLARRAAVEGGGVNKQRPSPGPKQSSSLHTISGRAPTGSPSGRLAVCPGANQSCWLGLAGHMTAGHIREPLQKIWVLFLSRFLSPSHPKKKLCRCTKKKKKSVALQMRF